MLTFWATLYNGHRRVCSAQTSGGSGVRLTADRTKGVWKTVKTPITVKKKTICDAVKLDTFLL